MGAQNGCCHVGKRKVKVMDIEIGSENVAYFIIPNKGHQGRAEPTGSNRSIQTQEGSQK